MTQTPTTPRDSGSFPRPRAWANLGLVNRKDQRAPALERDTVALAAAPFLTRGVELDALLVAVVDTIVDRLAAERGTLYLVDGRTRSLSSVVAHLPELERIRLDFGQGIAGTVASEGKVLSVSNPADDPRFDATFDRQTGFNTRSMLAMPIWDSRGEVIGVLQLLNAARGLFDADDEQNAIVLANQAGQVLEATSLYAELRARGPVSLDPAEQARVGPSYTFNQIVGESEAMQAVYAVVRKAAGTDATVLINGESGTGKELIARAVHVNSPRRGQPFVKLDCTTLPEALIENELFGHERGAFTGADRSTRGKVEAAGGGTLFIDEIGELPLALQAKLLRVLQDHEFERVGGTQTIHADIRVICATHRDLLAMIDRGDFREDLYYRVRVVPIRLPPLRERGRQDLLRLVEHFVDRYARRHDRAIRQVTPAALDRLLAHDFPGNIRELENCIESAVVLCDGGTIDAEDLPLALRPRRVGPVTPLGGGPRLGDPEVSLATLERAHIDAVLDACDGNQSEAARRLGIGRNTLARKLERGGD
ncbi:Response regulator of zinc sigma-54-dependent two-component system [Enhygromyxa salina]|uniref:Response regulator of zinc sigma-54-dependent two-component system n=1 Tax=Enhygromyxa salina TaxID=215803 RepID=A0A0C2D447_9BACT|nr:sigma-54-dependent Fis family transcriptional regulator [Enhygromyxa salina]KIG14872.1 Response regulator of zinc sigma-54-dependent two-component system [Enhygromyxa salina]